MPVPYFRHFPQMTVAESASLSWAQAPHGPEVTILFSFIEGWDTIKEQLGGHGSKDAKKALQLHNSAV